MGVRFDHREPGTPERLWREAAPWLDAPQLDLGVDRLLVLAAHPDDETLGAGGLIARAASSGIPVSVLVVTDGEGSHPHSPDPAALRRRRREETVGAVHRLAPRAAVSFLGVADGGVREARAAVTAAVAAVVRAAPDDRVLLAAPWWGDGHRDHRVLGEIALTLTGGGVAAVGYPVWMWHWAAPAEIETAAWRTVVLDPAARAAKAAAIVEHTSQLHADPARPEEGPMLHANMVAHFARDVEVFVASEAVPDAARADDRDTARARVRDTGRLRGAARNDAAPEADGDERHELRAANEREHAPDGRDRGGDGRSRDADGPRRAKGDTGDRPAGAGPTVAEFDAFHARHDDPWGLESRWYERRKRALLLAALPRERYASALELGCASGAVTRELAGRSASVVAVDASEVALDRARAHGVPPHVRYLRHELPEQWPQGRFDLVVLSELAYYWPAARLAAALERIDACTSEDAVLVACHWRPQIAGAPQGGDAVHAALRGRHGWRPLSRHVEELFVLDVLGRPAADAAAPG